MSDPRRRRPKPAPPAPGRFGWYYAVEASLKIAERIWLADPALESHWAKSTMKYQTARLRELLTAQPTGCEESAAAYLKRLEALSQSEI